MAESPEQRTPAGPSQGPGEAAPFTDELESSGLRWGHPKILVVVALLECCAAAGEGVTRWVVGTSVPASTLSFHTWLAFIGAVPAGWLGDRYLGAKRATVLGAALVVAGLIAVAIPSPFAICLGLAARAVGVALLRGNTLVLLSRSYEDREQRRLEGFIWVGFAVSLGGAVTSLLRNEMPSAGIVSAAVVAVLLAVALGAIRRAGPLDRTEPANDRPAFRTPVTTALVLAVAVVGALLYVVDRSVWWQAIATWLFPVSAVTIVVIFLAWWLRAARRLSIADNRRIGTFLKLLACAILFGAVSGVMASNPDKFDLPVPWTLLPLFSIGPGAAWVLRWRTRSQRPTPSAAGVFSVAFYLQSVACIVFAAMAVFANLDSVQAAQIALEAIFVGASGLASALIFAAGRSAAATIAPSHLTGTMLGVWRTGGIIGSSTVGTVVASGALDRDTHGIVLMVAAAACVLLGLLVHAARHTLARDEVAEPPPPVPPSRLRRLAMSLSATAAVLGIVWVVVGRGTDSGTIVAAARPVTFGDSATAYLPGDGTFGFVRFAPGSFAFGADPLTTGTLTTSSATGQPMSLDEMLIGKYEVTVAQYRQCAVEGACRHADPRAIEGPGEWPVRHVSWFEANQYCAWLEQKLAAIDASMASRFGDGLHVALPSEPEWERASTGRGVEGYPWRGPLAPARANYAASGRLAPVPVGEFSGGATVEDINDLSGNVAEWTRSEHRPYPYDAGDGRENPDARATTRVIRGGSFYDAASLLRVTARQAADPAQGYEFVGFRVVITRFRPQVGQQPPQSQTPAAAR